MGQQIFVTLDRWDRILKDIFGWSDVNPDNLYLNPDTRPFTQWYYKFWRKKTFKNIL